MRKVLSFFQKNFKTFIKKYSIKKPQILFLVKDLFKKHFIGVDYKLLTLI